MSGQRQSGGDGVLEGPGLGGHNKGSGFPLRGATTAKLT